MFKQNGFESLKHQPTIVTKDLEQRTVEIVQSQVKKAVAEMQ